MVPEEDRLNNAFVNTDISASFRGKSSDPPQLVHSTEGAKNH